MINRQLPFKLTNTSQIKKKYSLFRDLALVIIKKEKNNLGLKEEPRNNRL